MSTDLIRFENLPFVALGLLACVILHDWLIWKVNRWWSNRHPEHPRHPFSPLFTAIGVTYVCIGAACLIPPHLAGLVFVLFFIYGGMMGMLHFRRWWWWKP